MQPVYDLKELDAMPWTQIIRPKRGWFDLRLHELWKYRELSLMFVMRDFAAMYKQTALGPLWFIIQPLFTLGAYTAMFSSIAKLPTDDLPPQIFYLSGMVLWNYFSEILTKVSKSLISNANLFGKVYFPRMVMSVASALANLLPLGIQLLMLIGFMIFFRASGFDVIQPNWFILAAPLLVLQTALLAVGIGLFVSAFTIRYRDLQQLLGAFLTALLYVTPVVYPKSAAPDWMQFLLTINPLTPVIGAFRYGLLGTGVVDLSSMLYSIAVTLAIIISGMVVFNHFEANFVDTV
jgi:lipopolysaccharide transport system permease protein